MLETTRHIPKGRTVFGAAGHFVFAAHNLGGKSTERIGFKRMLKGGHLVQHAAKSPHIGLESVAMRVIRRAFTQWTDCVT